MLELLKKVNEQAKRTLKNLGVPADEEMKKLARRIQVLEERVAKG